MKKYSNTLDCYIGWCVWMSNFKCDCHFIGRWFVFCFRRSSISIHEWIYTFFFSALLLLCFTRTYESDSFCSIAQPKQNICFLTSKRWKIIISYASGHQLFSSFVSFSILPCHVSVLVCKLQMCQTDQNNAMQYYVMLFLLFFVCLLFFFCVACSFFPQNNFS